MLIALVVAIMILSATFVFTFDGVTSTAKTISGVGLGLAVLWVIFRIATGG
jgi:L-lactate permease